jgi:hypothetical protein
MEMTFPNVAYGYSHHFAIHKIVNMANQGCPTLHTFHMIKHDPRCWRLPIGCMLHQITTIIVSTCKHLEKEGLLSGQLSIVQENKYLKYNHENFNF